MPVPNTTQRVVTPLNEGWRYVAARLDGATTYEATAGLGESVTLPHTWNAVDGQDGGNDYRRGYGTYVRRLDARPGDDEVWLEVCGANASAQVFLNGTALGGHDGGYSTFRFELTPALAGENTLLVVVDNAANQAVYPQQADFTFYGGLYRDVRLIRVPAAHIALDDHGGPGFTAVPALDGTTATVALRAQVTGGRQVRFRIDGVGETVAQVSGGVAEASLAIADVRRWHGRRDPHLYTATAELLDGDSVADAVSLRFGCREFEVDPDLGFFLNGESYPLRGVSRHQDWEGVGNAITPEMMRTDLDLMLELGATTVRLAHYQHDQRFYDLCDEAGIVVWAEIPKITMFAPAASENAVSQLTELIVQNRHHAAIVCWGLSNEITIGGVTEESVAQHHRLNDLAHALDPTRLTTMAHAFVLEPGDPLMTLPDVMSYNLYYGWYLGDLEDNDKWFADFRKNFPGVAVGLSEYGADANPRFQTATPARSDYTEQYQARYHEHLAALIDQSPFLWATHVWNLADFGADGRNEGGNSGRNQKGLVSFDRTLKKDAFHLYRAYWSAEPFVHLCGRRYVDRPEAVSEVTVYSNQPEVSLYRDGEFVAGQTGSRVFRFEVPLTGEHEITARSGELSDTIEVRKVDQPNPDYSHDASLVANWFAEDLPAPDGFYSVWDKLGTIRRSPSGGRFVEQLMAQASATMGDVVKDMVITPAIQAVIDQMTLLSLLRQFGQAVPAEAIVAMNQTLNRIPRQEEAQ